MAVTARELRTLNVRRPFSRAEARAAGIRLREILGPQFHKILYDSYISSAVPITTRLRAEAALRISVPGSYISHHTAAELWDGVVPACSDVHITATGEAPRSRRQGIKAHATTRSRMTSTIHNLRVTSPAQTFLDLAGSLDLVDLVVLGDSLVKAKHVTPEELTAAASAWDGAGAARARRAARFVRKGVDSPKETRVRRPPAWSPTFPHFGGKTYDWAASAQLFSTLGGKRTVAASEGRHGKRLAPILGELAGYDINDPATH